MGDLDMGIRTWGIMTQEHDTSTRLSGKRALSTLHSFHQRPRILSLSRLFVTPTTNQVLVTRASVNWT